MAYAFIPIVVLVLVFGAYVFVQAPVTTRAQTTETTTSIASTETTTSIASTETTTSSTSTSINTSTLCTSTLIDTISTSTQSSEINIYWSYPSSFDSSPADFPSSGHSFNYTVGFDGYGSTYTIESVFSCTSGFSVTGIFWDGSNTPRYNLPQSVYNGTNFPFIISIASSLNNYTSDLNIYVLTSSSCCYFNGTRINS